MIETTSLTRRFGPITAVDRVTFSVEKGDIAGFLGPNGAGKSTTMRMLCGFLPPTEGEASICGYSVTDESIKARGQIGYLPENNPLYEDMRVKEYLLFRGGLKGLGGSKLEKRIKDVAGICEICDVLGRIIGSLSKGYRQRVGLSDALLSDPPILILDEPTVGLDPGQIVNTRALIKNLAENHTVLLSTHILPEVEAICNRVLIIAKGKIVLDDRVENLSSHLQKGKSRYCRIKGEAEKIKESLSSLCESVKEEGDGGYILSCRDNDVGEPLFNLCAKNGFVLLESTPIRHSLEEAFLELTKEEA